MQNKTILYIISAIFLISLISASADTPPVQNLKTLKPVYANTAPKIDGSLDDEVWKLNPAVDDIFITYNPHFGDILPYKTKVYMAYDEDNLYVAFYCYDDEPGKIKTSVTRRDSMFSDDWVGFALDAEGNRQGLYEFFINPSGMQGDLYNTPASGENSAPDWVWYSDGKLVKDGYIVEVRIPLKSIRFRSGEDVQFNVLFWRRISRLSMSGSWPALTPGKGICELTSPVIYGKLDHQLKLEILPEVTYSSIWDRQNPDAWSDADDVAELGLNLTYGITSSITADMTINPDFSQVESDSFQIVANQRYPIFYSEKRPFFMEAEDLFTIAGRGENMYTPVHTRAIVNPGWGARLTGSLGSSTFGFLASGDEWPGRKIEGEENPYLDKKALFLVGRVKYSLNGDNYIGLLYSGMELGGDYNRVLGGDLVFRFLDNHSFSMHYLRTFSSDKDDPDIISGNGLAAKYQYHTKTFGGVLEFEHYDENFRMDTAFYNRTGITSLTAIAQPRIILGSDGNAFLHDISPYAVGQYIHDSVTDLDDSALIVGLDAQFTKQGYLGLSYSIIDREGWAGELFSKHNLGGSANIQLTNWLYLHSCFDLGNAIYYDPEDPFLGDRFSYHGQVTFQPNDYLSQTLSYQYLVFDRESDGEKIYDYHILYSKTSYQVNKYLFFRALIQYDSYRELILTDLLASFTYIPGTVFHVGYGSLHQNMEWQPLLSEWTSGTTNSEYFQTSQSFFVKVSYRWQL